MPAARDLNLFRSSVLPPQSRQLFRARPNPLLFFPCFLSLIKHTPGTTPLTFPFFEEDPDQTLREYQLENLPHLFSMEEKSSSPPSHAVPSLDALLSPPSVPLLIIPLFLVLPCPRQLASRDEWSPTPWKTAKAKTHFLLRSIQLPCTLFFFPLPLWDFES